MRYVSMLLTVACVLLLYQRPTAGSAERTLTRDLDPVIVTGQALPSFAGANLTQLFLYAYRAGAWSQVPWQFDEV